MRTFISLLAIFLIAGTLASAYAEKPEGEKGKSTTLAKSTAEEKGQTDFISANNCLMWFGTSGMMAHNPTTDASGFEWPQGSSKYVIFTDGILWGGLIQGQARVGGATYKYGLQNGKIKPDGTATDIKDPRYRIYKVKKLSAEDYNQLSADEKVRLRDDFTQWPVEDGAPWFDYDRDGRYSPNFDEFLVGGDTAHTDMPAMRNDPVIREIRIDPNTVRIDSVPLLPDELVWFVSNDLDKNKVDNLYGSPPIGIELHTMIWAYRQVGPLSNMVFTKFTVINKGAEPLEEAYLSRWSDPDLGDAFDDFVGIDTTLSLGYCYNGIAKDQVYGIPPAVGYDFFQGPIIEAAGDTAHYGFGLRPGYRNLPVSTFAFYINGDGVYADPSLGESFGTTMMYRYMRGTLWNGQPYIQPRNPNDPGDPNTGQAVKVCLAGDPFTKKGWVDGLVSAPGDRRFLMNAGPFDLNPGDTQEVVVATVVGKGADRLSSLGVLKFNDKFAQAAFDNNFDLPKAPPSPGVLASAQDREILLYWGHPNQVKAIETFDDRGYKFQGYNVYQFPEKSSTLAEGKRIATFDIASDEITVILDSVIDERSGIPVSLPVQFGSDAGIQRQFIVNRDLINERPLVNNQPYYFAVTSYSYKPDVIPTQLESNPVIIEVRPQTDDVGVRAGIEYKDEVPVEHVTGAASGIVSVVVVDPLKLTGDTYEVTFDSLGTVYVPYNEDLDVTVITDTTGGGSRQIVTASFEDTLKLANYGAWTLKNATKNQVLISMSTSLKGLETESYSLDGFQIGILGTGYYNQFKKYELQSSSDYWESDEMLKIEWLGGGPEVYEPYSITHDKTPEPFSWRPAYWYQPNNTFGSAYRGYEVKKTLEVRLDRNKKSKGYVYDRLNSQTYSFAAYAETPIQVWDVTDPDNHKQLSFIWVEQKDLSTFDRVWAPNTFSDRDWIWILDEPYSDTPNPTYTRSTPTPFNFLAEAKNMPLLYHAIYQRRSNVQGPLRYPWSNGSGWRITPKVAFSAEDLYRFQTTPPYYKDSLAKIDLTRINVFPNPYMGSNQQELNKYQRFVTFSHLPAGSDVHFRIYTMSGTLVRSFIKYASADRQGLDKGDGTIKEANWNQYTTWDLQNDNGLPVGSGMYIIHIEMPSLGVEKILKLGVINEQQYLDRI